MQRQKLLSWFAYLVGGWNASAGKHCGRLAFDVDISNDEDVARHVLEQYKQDIECPLLVKIANLEHRLAKAGISIND